MIVIINVINQKGIPKEQQGIAFGGISGIGSIAAFVGALFTENIFSYPFIIITNICHIYFILLFFYLFY